MDQSKKATKKESIIAIKRNSPSLTAKDIAELVKTTSSYVYKVLSQHRRKERSKPEVFKGSRSIGFRVVGYYEAHVSEKSVEALDVPVVNGQTGMKQIGRRGAGDPCSCQIHANGKILIYAHQLGWEDWLCGKLVEHGWHEETARLLLDNCNYNVQMIESGKKIPNGLLPSRFGIRTDWGYYLVRDDSPSKNTLDVKLHIPSLDAYLGLPEIRKKLDLLCKTASRTQMMLRRFLERRGT